MKRRMTPSRAVSDRRRSHSKARRAQESAPIRAGSLLLLSEFLGTEFLIVRARERGQQGNDIVNLRFTERRRLHVLAASVTNWVDGRLKHRL